MPTHPASVRSWVSDLLEQGFTPEETHISRVFLRGSLAYKVKKEVDFGYLDYGSPEKRRLACEREVELNRRLSPEVYLGVVPVTLDPSGRRVFGGSGDPVDWAVEMIRLPESQRGDHRLEEGSLTAEHLESLAVRLAAFHAEGEVGARIARLGDSRAIRRIVRENFLQARPTLRSVLSDEESRRLETRYLGYISEHAHVFRERMKGGRVRDGHGDLRLGQIYFDAAGKATILDCIEFNERFRYGDVAADVAFLAMDLSVRGREDLAEGFLADYARESGDYGLYAVVDFYEGLRACVRGKIAGYGMEDPRATADGRARDSAKAGKYFRYALTKIAPPPSHAPVLAFCGGMGTGKSTLAAAVGRRLAAPVLGSDRIRKALAGLEPWSPRHEDLWRGLYGPEWTEKAYGELLRLAGIIMASGRPVIVDASFRTRAHRDSLRRLAADLGRHCRFVECVAPADLVEERLSRRARKPSISDGRPSLAGDFLASWEPLSGSEDGTCLSVDSSRPMEESLQLILEGVGWRR